jgi:hypothetical protein
MPILRKIEAEFLESSRLQFDRPFQIWADSVSHKQLLIRSTKSPQHPTRIDILFKPVRSVHLPTSFENISIVAGSTLGTHAEYVVRGNAHGAPFEGYVAADVVVCHEDEKDYTDPSAIYDGALSKLS